MKIITEIKKACCFNRFALLVMSLGLIATFTACSSDDDSDIPVYSLKDVEGNYSGNMLTETAPSVNPQNYSFKEEQPQGATVTAEVKDNQIPETTLQKPTIVYGDVIIGVHGENFSMMFDKKEGGISSLKYNDFEYITRTPKVSFWRAMTDNDTGASEPYNLAQWYSAGKFAKYKTVSWLEQEDALKITFTYQAACVPTFEFTVTYTAHFDGKLGVCVNYAGVSGMPDMPVLALDFKMKKQLCNFQYYGLGPDENYSDRCKGARLGLWKSTAKENLSGYLNPQECGNRTGVRTLSIHDDMQHGLTFQKASAPFEMSVLPYSAYELENAMHPDELPSVRCTWVRIAAKQMGVGGDDSWGAPVHEEYRIHADQLPD